MQTIVAPDGVQQASGTPTINGSTVVINNTEFNCPPFTLIPTAPPSKWATWSGSAWVDHPEPAGPMPTLEEYTQALQDMLDAEARTHNYDGILSLASYAASTHPPFAEEGKAGLDWRDAVWGTSYATMAQVQLGNIPQPTIPELLAMMPKMVWP